MTIVGVLKYDLVRSVMRGCLKELGSVVDAETEYVVLDKEGITERFQYEGLIIGMRRVVITLQQKVGI